VSGRKIAIVGTGANGASIGADLALAGEDVVFVEQWPAHVEAMRSDGITVDMPERSITVPVRALHLCEVATLRETFDVVLILVKAYDTRWAAHLIAPHLAEDALVAGVQNGMTTDVVADVVGPERTIGAVIEITSEMTTPGIVERHSGPERSWFAVGGIHRANRGREEEVASLLRRSGRVEVVEDIEAAKWMKLVSNATTLATTAILDLSMVEAAAVPEMRELMLRSGQEALEASVGLGNGLLPIFGLRQDDVARPETIVETLLDTLLDGFVLPHSTTTILQDWRKGRRSEVDDINGHVVRTLEGLGRSAPVNAAVVELATAIERGELRPDRSNLELLADRVRAREHGRVPPELGDVGQPDGGAPESSGLEAAGQGFEPQLPDPESGVLPLDDPATGRGAV
jgi:2-dehydropantoate 2-reductase